MKIKDYKNITSELLKGLNSLTTPKLIEPEILNNFERKYDVILPELLWFILTEIGYSNIFGGNYINSDGNLYEPYIEMNPDFFIETIKLGLDQDTIDSFDGFYNWKNNSFENDILQKAYLNKGANSNELLSKLLDTGVGHCGSSDFILLNGNSETSQYAIVGDGQWANKKITIANRTYVHQTYNSIDIQFNDYIINILKSI